MLAGCLACSSGESTAPATDAVEEVEVEKASLQGTWKLQKARWGDMDTLEEQTTDIYKIFTKDRFFFIYFDDEKVSGAGGGTFVATDSTFTETLSYYSWDSTAAGTNQTFNYTIEANQLHQFGKINDTEKYNDYIIDEYYVRVEDGLDASQSGIQGVWEYSDGTGNTSEYLIENKVKSWKIITPKYFHTIFTYEDSGAYHGTGFGTYTLEGNKYVETISAFSFDQSAVVQAYDFTVEIQEDAFTQSGKINSDQYKNYTVEDNYKRIE